MRSETVAVDHRLCTGRSGSGRCRSAHDELGADSLKECTLAGSKMWGDPRDMIDVAEHHAKVDGITRVQMDEYALASHRRAIEAIDAGRLDDEIVRIEVPQRGGGNVGFDVDEHPRRDIAFETLARLPAVRAGGSITAGNASSFSDGAAAAIVCNESGLRRTGLVRSHGS